MGLVSGHERGPNRAHFLAARFVVINMLGMAVMMARKDARTEMKITAIIWP